jgi:hypothetical protein
MEPQIKNICDVSDMILQHSERFQRSDIHPVTQRQILLVENFFFFTS